MHKLHKTRVLPYSHKQLFDLVMDVESYPKFLPFCVGARVIEACHPREGGNDKKGGGEGSNVQDSTQAELMIKFGLFTKSYRSLITYKCDENSAIIEAEAISGPFKHLNTVWKFTQIDNFTLIEFSLDFELESLLLNKMIGATISTAYIQMINAFEKRASEIYDKSISS